jgi:amidase
VREMWEEGGFEGAPVDLQICGRRYHDSEVMGALGLMSEILELP